MDFRYQLVVKANRDFVHLESIVFYRIADIAQENWYSLADFSEWAANVHISGSIFPCPFPGRVEHPSMKFSQIKLVQWLSGTHDPGIECPPLRGEDVGSFPFVQLSSRREIRN